MTNNYTMQTLFKTAKGGAKVLTTKLTAKEFEETKEQLSSTVEKSKKTIVFYSDAIQTTITYSAVNVKFVLIWEQTKDK